MLRSLKYTFFHMIEKITMSNSLRKCVYWTAKHMDLRRGMFQLWHEEDETGSRSLKPLGLALFHWTVALILSVWLGWPA